MGELKSTKFNHTKTFRFIGLALTAILMCVNFASCSSGGEEPEIPQVPETPQRPSVPEDPKMCTVSINLENLVNVEEMPLGRATSNNDLYLIHFYQGGAPNIVSYAYGLFDRSTDISINLIEGEIYNIHAVAIKDGKNKVYKGQDEKYAYPFNAKLTNSFTYNESYEFRPDLHYVAGGDGQTPSVITAWEEFYTSSTNHTAKAGSTINLSLSRFYSFATQFKAEDMPEGKLHIYITANKNEQTYTSSEMIVTSTTTPIEQIFSVGEPLFNDLSYDNMDATLHFTWEKADETEIALEDIDFTFKKDYKYIFTVQVNPFSGLSLSFSTDNFNVTEEYHINDGTATKQTN